MLKLRRHLLDLEADCVVGAGRANSTYVERMRAQEAAKKDQKEKVMKLALPLNDKLDICPKCGQNTWMFNIYLHFTAPGRFYGRLGKSARRHRDINCEAALWETVSWWCSNGKCMHHIDPVRRVRLD